MRRATTLLTLMLVITACSGAAEDPIPPTTTDPGQSSASTATPTTTTAAERPSTTSAPTTTADPVSAPPILESLAGSLGDVAPLEVTVDGTTRPRFSWSGGSADSYLAVVTDDAGDVLWAWGGESPTVTVGAGEVDRGGVGARLAGPSWLQVVGLDAAGGIVAASEPTPVG